MTDLTYQTYYTAMKRAVLNRENIKPGGDTNWDFVDADTYDLCDLLSAGDNDKHYELFDAVADRLIEERLANA